VVGTKWIPLTEYSNKYRVSISTLRRRIRNDRVEVNYLDGKYLIRDAPLTDHYPTDQILSGTDSVPPRTPISFTDFDGATGQKVQQPPTQPVSPPPPKMRPVENTSKTTNLNSQAANSLNKMSGVIIKEDLSDNAHQLYLNELKRAYSLILQEKEEQVLILKDEIADLQTLVKVLESENNRLKALVQPKVAPPIGIKLPDPIEEAHWHTELEIE